MPLYSNTAQALKSTTTNVDVGSASAPSNGQVLTATSPSTAGWSTPAGGGSPSITTLILAPVAHGQPTSATYNANSSVSSKINLVNIEQDISVNQVSVEIVVFTTAGSLRWGIYTQDGQTQKASVLFSSIAGTGIRTANLSSVLLTAGTYYQAITPLEGEYTIRSTAMTNAPQMYGSVIGKPKYIGDVSVAGGALPATFTPTTLPVGPLNWVAVRLDN